MWTSRAHCADAIAGCVYIYIELSLVVDPLYAARAISAYSVGYIYRVCIYLVSCVALFFLYVLYSRARHPLDLSSNFVIYTHTIYNTSERGDRWYPTPLFGAYKHIYVHQDPPVKMCIRPAVTHPEIMPPAVHLDDAYPTRSALRCEFVRDYIYTYIPLRSALFCLLYRVWMKRR